MEVQHTQMSKNQQRKKNKRRNRNNKNNKNTHQKNSNKNEWDQAHNGNFIKTNNGNQHKKNKGMEANNGFKNVNQTTLSSMLQNGNNRKDNSENNGIEAKDNELKQIIDMFGEIISKEMIEDCWAASKADYMQTISCLSEMVEQIEQSKPKAEAKEKEPIKSEEEEKKTSLKLNSNSRAFVPGAGRVIKRQDLKEESKDLENQEEEKKIDTDEGDEGKEYSIRLVYRD